jgi:hypothetical protein
MRQILVCAWLVVVSVTAAACSGEKFTASDDSAAASDDSSDGNGSTPPSRNEAAASGEDDSNPQLGSAGKSASGGATSGGGASATAGTGSSGGSTLAGGASSGTSDTCTMGEVKFKMVPSPDLEHDYLCDAGCGTGWLTITDQQGAAAYSIFPGCGSTSCNSCSPLPCAAAACLPTPLTAEGSELTWAGTYMTEDTCGMNQACQRPACVQPGKYKAKACAALNAGASEMAGGSCTPKSMQLCAEVEFEFPATTEVKLVLKKL